MSKKLISAAVALSLVIGVAPTAAFAGENVSADGVANDAANAAFSVLDVSVDKTVLGQTIAEVESRSSSNYTESSWNELMSALEQAQIVYADESATQDDIDAAVSALESALHTLVLSDHFGNVYVDKDTLELALEQAEQIDDVGYTSTSWEAFLDAYDEALDAYNDSSSTQTQVNLCEENLLSAMAALQMAFLDITGQTDENLWYYDAVYGLASAGIITGYGPDYELFGVGDMMNRADFVTALWRMESESQPDSYAVKSSVDASGFADVDSGEYYAQAVSWAQERGIVTGYYDGEGQLVFGPDDPITFEQAIAMISRLETGYDDSLNAD
ncbi:MAG: S-layer homology domain-containing protein, partial [Eggerthellaceae bacterium]|nr:S-layer homology domain-containing protein [Eggerthellaceae bacterium]